MWLNKDSGAGRSFNDIIIKTFDGIARGCGCIGRPAFPTPSVFKGERFMHHSGASRRGIASSRLQGSEAIVSEAVF
jgi:hypothetical protein